MIFLFWIVFSFLIGKLGETKKLGFGTSFFLSLLLSPIIGLFIVLFSADVEKNSYQEKVSIDTLDLTKKTDSTNSSLPEPSTPSSSTADEIRKLHQLLVDGIITQEEFDIQKSKLLS